MESRGEECDRHIIFITQKPESESGVRALVSQLDFEQQEPFKA